MKEMRFELSLREAMAVLHSYAAPAYPEDAVRLQSAKSWLEVELHQSVSFVVTAPEAWAIAHATPGIAEDALPLFEVRRRLHVALTDAASREVPVVTPPPVIKS